MQMIPKNRLLAGCVTAACLLLWSGFAFGGDDLTIITEDYPPLNYVEHEELKGPAMNRTKLEQLAI